MLFSQHIITHSSSFLSVKLIHIVLYNTLCFLLFMIVNKILDFQFCLYSNVVTCTLAAMINRSLKKLILQQKKINIGSKKQMVVELIVSQFQMKNTLFRCR